MINWEKLKRIDHLVNQICPTIAWVSFQKAPFGRLMKPVDSEYRFADFDVLSDQSPCYRRVIAIAILTPSLFIWNNCHNGTCSLTVLTVVYLRKIILRSNSTFGLLWLKYEFICSDEQNTSHRILKIRIPLSAPNYNRLADVALPLPGFFMLWQSEMELLLMTLSMCFLGMRVEIRLSLWLEAGNGWH